VLDSSIGLLLCDRIKSVDYGTHCIMSMYVGVSIWNFCDGDQLMLDPLWNCLFLCLEFNVGRWWVISLINLPSYLMDGSHVVVTTGLLHLWNSRITLTCDTSMLYATSSFVTFYPFTYQIIFDLCVVNSLGEFKTHSKYSMHSLPSFHLWIVSKNISLFWALVF